MSFRPKYITFDCHRTLVAPHLCFSDDELQHREQRLRNMRDALGGDDASEMLDHAALGKRLPGNGPEVAGASYSPMDGHVNALKLLRALHAACRHRGVPIQPISLGELAGTD